jgi:quinol monooxygenase YgiN
MPTTEETVMVRVGLYVRLEAAPGREDEVAEFLRAGRALVEEEPGTIVWYALQLGPTTFAIFDAFEDDAGRDAHLNGAVAQALGQQADLFASAPSIERVDVLAAK